MHQNAEQRPRVLLISSCDALAELACRHLFTVDSSYTIVGVVKVRMPTTAKYRLIRTAISKGAFYYVCYLAAENYVTALGNGLRRLAARLGSGVSRVPTIREGALARRIPIHVVRDVNDAQTAGLVSDLQPDLILSVRPGQIFRRRLLDLAPRIANLHCTMLPKYRGIGGVMQSLAAGERTLGCTVHFVESEAVDAGPILGQQSIDAEDGRSVFYHTVRLYEKAGECLPRWLSQRSLVEEGRDPGAEGSYFSWPNKGAWQKLKQTGRSLIELRDVFIADRPVHSMVSNQIG